MYPDELSGLMTAYGIRGTNCAHILSSSTSQDISSSNTNGPKVNYSLPLCIDPFTDLPRPYSMITLQPHGP